jgi:hypothetical protein
MNEERIKELVNKSIDGLIAEDEQKELDSFFAYDPELKKDFYDMKKSSTLIDNLPEYEPSPNIKKNILNAVESSNKNTREKLSQRKMSFVLNYKIILPFAFGVAACLTFVLLWNSSDKSTYNKESVSGSMGMMESLPYDSREIYSTELLGIESSLGIYQNKDTLFVTMDKKNSEQISVGYRFEPELFSFIGIKENTPTSPVVKNRDGAASVLLFEPSKSFMMFKILKPASEMDIKISNSERQIFRYKFEVGSKIR